MLEVFQEQLSHSVIKMHSMLVASGCWNLGTVDVNSLGQPVIHSIIAALGYDQDDSIENDRSPASHQINELEGNEGKLRISHQVSQLALLENCTDSSIG